MHQYVRTFLKLAAGGAVVLGLAGCQSTSARHKQAVVDATRRWQQTRSAVVISMAQQSFNRGDLDQTESTLLEAVRLDPENAQLHLLAGRVALERGQLERSHGRLQKAIDLDDQAVDALYYQGIVLERWQRYEPALARYRQAYARQADNITFLLAVAEMLVATDQVDQAIALLSSKVVYFDQSAAVRVALAQLHTLRGDHARAASLLLEAQLLDPENTAIAEELARVQLSGGRITDAIGTLERLCAETPLESGPDRWRLLASAYCRAGNVRGARAIYRRLRDQAPQDVDNWIRLGELAWLDQDQRAALAAGHRAIGLAPQRHEVYMLAGMVLYQQGRAAEALRMLTRAAELAPDNADLEALRGLALEKSGQAQAAPEGHDQAVRGQPGDARAKRLVSTAAADQERR